MLFNDINHFNFSVNNVSAYAEATYGTPVFAAATANVMGSVVTLIAGASVTENIYHMDITFCSGFLNATVRNYLCDLMIDPNGGTNWQPWVSGLMINGPSLIRGGYSYNFPLYLPKGTSVGAKVQCTAASAGLLAGLFLYGKPTRPEVLNVGSKVQSLGVNSGLSAGTAITLGTSTKGSYTASLGKTDGPRWWWEVGYAANDTTQTLSAQKLDVAVNTTNKLICAEDITFNTDANEATGKSFGMRPPIRWVQSGEDVFVRGANCTVAPDSATTVAVYAVQ